MRIICNGGLCLWICSQEECLSMTELLKRFQNRRAHLNNILQISEQTISEQTSYVGKENLQRLITRV